MALDFSKINSEIVGRQKSPLLEEECTLFAKPILAFVPELTDDVTFRDFVAPYLKGSNTYAQVRDKILEGFVQGLEGNENPEMFMKAVSLIENNYLQLRH